MSLDLIPKIYYVTYSYIIYDIKYQFNITETPPHEYENFREFQSIEDAMNFIQQEINTTQRTLNIIINSLNNNLYRKGN